MNEASPVAEPPPTPTGGAMPRPGSEAAGRALRTAADERRHWRRRLAEALSRPGRLVGVSEPVDCPDGMPPVAAALLHALSDHDTPVWLPPSLCESRWASTWLRHIVGARRVTRPEEASVVLATRRDRVPRLGPYPTRDRPGRRIRPSTLVVEVAGFDGPDAWWLEGPGLPAGSRLNVSGAAAGFPEAWTDARGRESHGVDAVLVGPDAFVCLPCGTRLRGLVAADPPLAARAG